MGKDATQLLRHCVRLLVRVSTDLLAIRLSGNYNFHFSFIVDQSVNGHILQNQVLLLCFWWCHCHSMHVDFGLYIFCLEFNVFKHFRTH